MARLRVTNAEPGVGPLRWSIETWPKSPPPEPEDERPQLIATERMWWRKNERLAYPAGASYPEEEVPLLVGDAEHWKNLREGNAGHDQPSSAGKRNSRRGSGV
jgi:hypothetical protein